jgi:phage/plasmid-associated DNA primase
VYIAENDDWAEFTDRHLVADPQGRITKEELYKAYQTWCGEVGKRHVHTQRNLGSKLLAKGWREFNSNGVRGWQGWRRKDTKKPLDSYHPSELGYDLPTSLPLSPQ